ncbi:MAG: hypothetical protein DHS20C15_26610 [Planctomycetota bacterium]|nr:MAG: hypothetical protein DHS20C15_26610 [Planctomycetota bacterium]
MTSRSHFGLPLVGWREWVALPDFDVPFMKAKIDTGALTSSLHAFDIETFERGGREMVRFSIHPRQRSSRREVRVEAPLVDRRVIRSSTGHEQRRLVIATTLVLREERLRVEITLTRRDAMGFRLLLGRRALRGKFLVDPGRSFYGGTQSGRKLPPKPRRPKKKPKRDSKS